jgi:hypothetical protein
VSIRFVIPVRTLSPNRVKGTTRGAAFAHAARKKKERNTAKLCTLAALPRGWLLLHSQGEITLTRLSAGKLDGDNLVASMKSTQDGIADALGVDDGSSAVRWVYGQARASRGVYGVQVEIL